MFSDLPGVLSTRVGYTGGLSSDPTYGSVCSGDGHTEAIRIEFDPDVISFRDILEAFWSLHNPTVYQKDQYRSAVWAQTEEQAAVAQEAVQEIEEKLGRVRGVSTRVESPAPFHSAEWYHQSYHKKNSVRLAALAVVVLTGSVPPGTIPYLQEARQLLAYLIAASLIPQLLPGFDKIFSALD